MPVDHNGMTEEQKQQIDDARVLNGIETGLKQSNSYQMVYGFDFENSYDVRTGVDACFGEALSRGAWNLKSIWPGGCPWTRRQLPWITAVRQRRFYEQVKAIFEE